MRGADNTYGTPGISEYPWMCKTFQMGLTISCWCLGKVGISPIDFQYSLRHISWVWGEDGAVAITPTQIRD